MPPALQIGPRARAQMSFAVRHLLGTLAVGGAEDSSHHRSASFWSDLDDGSSVPKGAEGSSPSALPRLCAAATASSYRRCNTGEGGLLLLEYASRGRSWQRLLEVPYEPKGLTTGDYYYWLPHWSRRAPTFPERSRFPPPDPRRVCALRLKLFPPEFVTILYCTPAGWTPGGKGFARAACAADSEYHVLVPSEAWSGLLSGRGTTCPYPQPPAGLAKEHIRVALTAQGVRYAVLAQVGTLEATPAFRLSAAGLHERLSSTVVAGGPCLRREPWRAVIDFLNFDFWFSAGFFFGYVSLWETRSGGAGREGQENRKVKKNQNWKK